MNTRSYYIQIDGLRFIAITAVLFEHFVYPFAKYVHAGFFGVDLFFVLSGFLISEILLIDKTANNNILSSLKNFLIRRSLRILPVYYLLCIVLIITFKDFRKVASYALFYVVNWNHLFSEQKIPTYALHFWSLSVEEQFYIFWPIIILSIPKKYLSYTIMLFIISSIMVMIITNDFLITPSRLYELSGGGLLAYLKVYYNSFYKSSIYKKCLFMFLVAVPIGFFNILLFIFLLSLCLVYIATNNGFKGWFEIFLKNKVVSNIGRVSYGIYLYHQLVGYIFTTYLFGYFWNSIDFSFFPVLRWHSWIIKFPLYFLISIGIANLSFKYIEKPFLSLKRHFS